MAARRSTRLSVACSSSVSASIAIDAKPKKRARKADEGDAPSEPPNISKVKPGNVPPVAGPSKDDGKPLEGLSEDKKPRGKRAAKKAKVALGDEIWPERHYHSRKFVGAHVSSAGGVENAPLNACRIGASAFALFLKSQRQWSGPPLSAETLSVFPLYCDPPLPGSSPSTPQDGKLFDFNRRKHVLPHGSYLVNLANPDQEKWTKAYTAFVEELKRAESLGIGLFNFHPGSTTGACSRDEGIALVAKGINAAHAETKSIRILIENMAGKGNMIGGSFEDLRDIIAMVKDPARVGVCFDTCHAFASGYDLRTRSSYEATMDRFGKIVGFNHLKALHLNDSKAGFKSHRDLHENIGLGELGLMPFFFIMNDPRLDDIPLILETPMLDGTLDPGGSGGVWRREIAMLYKMEGLTGDGDMAEVQALVAEVKELLAEQEENRAAKGDKGAKGGGKSRKRKPREHDEGCESHDEAPPPKERRRGSGRSKGKQREAIDDESELSSLSDGGVDGS